MSFQTVYDMPILSNIGVSYTVGKLLDSSFQWNSWHLHTSDVVPAGVPEHSIFLVNINKHFVHASKRALVARILHSHLAIPGTDFCTMVEV